MGVIFKHFRCVESEFELRLLSFLGVFGVLNPISRSDCLFVDLKVMEGMTFMLEYYQLSN